jgi:hypothetical protein
MFRRGQISEDEFRASVPPDWLDLLDAIKQKEPTNQRALQEASVSEAA